MSSTSRTTVDVQELGRMLYEKRKAEGLTLEDVSRETNISPATLSRLERQRMELSSKFTPATRTVAQLMRWLRVPVSSVLDIDSQGDDNPDSLHKHLEAVQAHLRTSKQLDSRSAELLGSILGLAYQQIAKAQSDNSEQEGSQDD